MTIGIAMLAHQRVDRAGAVAGSLARQGASVCIHLDPRSDPDTEAQLRRHVSDAQVVSAHRADWGRFGMIEATWAAVELLLNDPAITHICLISGGCLPLRPLAELEAHIAASPDADFIESVPVDRDAWVQDGLSIERFTLFHPFSHRRNPGLFSASVTFQRSLRLRRRLPRGLTPHLGGQWWCLRADTLRAIRDHDARPRWDRFFRRSWIPDESYFQSLVRVVRPRAEPLGTLHLGGFNLRGRPHVFHDDHLTLMEHSDRFFARKIDPDAEGLYRYFLAPATRKPRRCAAKVAAAFAAANTERRDEGRGLLTPARLPQGVTLTRAETHRPYVVLLAPDDKTVDQLHPSLADVGKVIRLHGRLFQPDGSARFAGAIDPYRGNLTTDPILRDYRPAQFLSRLVWIDREHGTAFWMAPVDDHPVRVHLVADPHARLILLGNVPERLAALRAGFPRPKGPSLGLRAWYRAVPPVAAPAMAETLSELLLSDWSDPSGWEVPA